MIGSPSCDEEHQVEEVLFSLVVEIALKSEVDDDPMTPRVLLEIRLKACIGRGVFAQEISEALKYVALFGRKVVRETNLSPGLDRLDHGLCAIKGEIGVGEQLTGDAESVEDRRISISSGSKSAAHSKRPVSGSTAKSGLLNPSLTTRRRS